MRSKVEVLLMLAENEQQEGDELINERDRTYFAHARRLVELSAMIDHARAVIEAEKVRFGRWLPKEEGQGHAAQGRGVPRDDQPEHSRIAPPRQPPALASSNSGNRVEQRTPATMQDPSRAKEVQAR